MTCITLHKSKETYLYKKCKHLVLSPFDEITYAYVGVPGRSLMGRK